MKKPSKRTLAILIYFCFFISFLTPLMDFTKLDFRLGNPKTFTNYLFKDKVYNMTLEDIYDDADPYKLYTSSYFQSEYFNSSYEWQQIHNESVDSGTDNNELENGTSSGDFEATYSFEGETGLTGTNIDFVDSLEYNALISVESSLDGHNEVLKLEDNDGVNHASLTHNTEVLLSFGTVEFWFYADDLITWRFVLYDGNLGDMLNSVYLGINSGNLQYYDGAWHTIDSVSADTWYHIRFDFECSSGGYEGLAINTFHLYLDGVKYEDLTMRGTPTEMDHFRVASSTGADVGVVYVDAVGFKTGDYESTESFDYTTEAGVYYGTYDFRDNSITGWSYAAPSTLFVISTFNNHKKVLEWDYAGSTGNQFMVNAFTSTQTTGTIEFYWAHSTPADTTYFYTLDSSGAVYGFFLAVYSGKYQYRNSAGAFVDTGITPVANTFYHHRIVFTCTAHTFDWYINGVLKVDDGQFYTATPANSLKYFQMMMAANSHINYLDAVGYTWDTTSHSGKGYKLSYNYPDYDINPLVQAGWSMITTTFIKTGVFNFDEHQNVLGFKHDGTAGQYSFIRSPNFSPSQSSGTMEMWISVSSAGAHIIYCGNAIICGLDSLGRVIWYERHVSHVGSTVGTGSLHHFKIIFNCNGGSNSYFSLYVNGNLEVSNALFYDDTTLLTYIRFQQDGGNTAWVYLDALGYSWDSGYTVGDNLNAYDQDYEIGDNFYPDNIDMVEGSYDYTDNMQTLDTVCTDFTSTLYGMYPATYSFEGETGLTGTNIDFVDRLAGTPTVVILDTLDGHREELKCSADAQWEGFYDDLSPSRTSGTVEFWIRLEATSKTIAFILEQDAVGLLGVRWNSDGNVQYYDGGYHAIEGYAANTWYHVKVSFDCSTLKWNLWINTVLKSGAGYNMVSGTYINNVYFLVFLTGWTYFHVDAVGYSWDPNYEVGDNLIAPSAQSEFSISTPFTNYRLDLLSIHVESHQKTNISQQIYFKIWNYDTSSYDTITSATETTSITKREFNSIIPDKYISSSGVKLYWQGENVGADFTFSIDYLFIRICYKMYLWHEVSFDTNGLWRYRWEIHGSLEYTDWVQFEVVDPIPNFHAISESDVTTRWILQGSDISPVENFSDDISGSNWFLSETSDFIIDTNNILTDDSYVDEYYPNTNYGSGSTLFVDYYIAYNVWSYIKYVYPYLDLNITSNSSLYCYVLLSGGEFYMYNTTDFSESTITWNNKPSLDTYQNYLSTGFAGYKLFDIGYPSYCYALVSKDGDEDFDISIYSSEHTNKPYIRHHFSKIYQGNGYVYMQTDETELIALLSEDYGSHYTLSSGDYFEVDFQTSSDSLINLILYKDSVEQKTLTLSSSGNTNFNRHIAQISVSEDLEFDQLKISSTFEDTDYVKIYDIKTFKYTLTGDYEDFLVSPNGQRDVYLTPDDYNLKISERIGVDSYDLREDFNLTIPVTNRYVFIPLAKLQCRLTLYSTIEPTIPLTFENYHVEINRSYNNEYGIIDLVEPIFYADVGSFIDINVKDRFDNLINSFEDIVADSYIELDIDVYQLQIKNLMEYQTTVYINGSHVYPLLPYDSLYFMLSENWYLIEYTDDDGDDRSFLIHLISNQAYVLNRSKMCFLSYTNQRGEYLEFNRFKTYINSTLLYQNIFYEDAGDDVNITITDLYDYEVYEDVYTVVSGDNYIGVILTMYSLKVMSQQLVFNHINITRDPNYYYSPYYWSEWIAPSEIIKFNLFAGYYKINLTNTEAGSSSYYSYNFTGDDILLITSDNTIYNVLVNLANVNATIGNQITMVEINITNQNSQINNSIIMIDVNLGSINSTLGTMLLNLDVDVTNIANNISALYIFTNNSFINLNNDMNLSFIYMENNILMINQTISNLIVGISNDIYLINGTISTMITQMGNNLLLMNVSINTALFDLGTTLNLIGSNITNNFILLNNSIYLNSLNINDSRIAVINNLLLVNNTLSTLIAQVYSSVYLINNSIYTAVVDLGTYLSLMNNTIYGNMSIVLQMNEFLSALYQKTMFSQLLNWTNIGDNVSLIESQIDVWKFINHYLNQSIEIHLKYQDQIEKMVISADNFKDQWLPKYNASYNLWSVKDQKYLDEWKDLDPDNKTVDFGFYKAEVPEIPDFNEELSDWILAFLIIGIIAITLTYGIIRVRKKSEKRRDVREMLTVPTDEDVIKKKKRTNKINKTQYETALK